MLKSVTAAAVLSLSMFAAPATAQDPTGAAMVTATLDQLPGALDLTEQTRSAGRLPQGRSQTVTANVLGGGDIVFIAVCDENCSDIDIIVKDSAGNEVGRDVLDDDMPMVRLQNTSNDRYSIEVGMSVCTGTCNWGLASYK